MRRSIIVFVGERNMGAKEKEKVFLNKAIVIDIDAQCKQKYLSVASETFRELMSSLAISFSRLAFLYSPVSISIAYAPPFHPHRPLPLLSIPFNFVLAHHALSPPPFHFRWPLSWLVSQKFICQTNYMAYFQ
jgi:hypothetical protein